MGSGQASEVPPPGRSRSRPRAGPRGRASRPASLKQDAVGFEPVRPAVEGETGVVLAHLFVEGRDHARRRYRAGSRRSGRRGLRPHRPSGRGRNGSARRPRSRPALVRAVARAPGDRSIPKPGCLRELVQEARPGCSPIRCRNRRFAGAPADRGGDRGPSRRRSPYRAGAPGSRERGERAGPRTPGFRRIRATGS